MEINKKELRKMSRSFRVMANRILNAHFQEVDSILKMFIDYIDNNDLISNYIDSINVIEIDVEKEVSKVLKGYGRVVFNTGSCIDEEIVYTYKIIEHMVEQKVPVTSVCKAYDFSTKYQDQVKAFGTRVILPFVNHIESYLVDIATDMGFDEDTKHTVTITGGQVNIAKDQATIYATQTNGIDVNELDKLVECVQRLVTDKIGPQEKEIINDNIEVIQEELKKDNPRKGFIRTAITGLQGMFPKIKDSIELIAAITTIIQFASTIL